MDKALTGENEKRFFCVDSIFQQRRFCGFSFFRFFNFALKASLIQFEEAFANFLTTSIKDIYITYQPSPANQHAD